MRDDDDPYLEVQPQTEDEGGYVKGLQNFAQVVIDDTWIEDSRPATSAPWGRPEIRCRVSTTNSPADVAVLNVPGQRHLLADKAAGSLSLLPFPAHIQSAR